MHVTNKWQETWTKTTGHKQTKSPWESVIVFGHVSLSSSQTTHDMPGNKQDIMAMNKELIPTFEINRGHVVLSHSLF